MRQGKMDRKRVGREGGRMEQREEKLGENGRDKKRGREKGAREEKRKETGTEGRSGIQERD